MTRSVSVGPRALAPLLALAALAGCGGMVKERGHQDVARLVEDRTGQPTHWDKGPPSDDQVATWVDELLAGGLTSERAVRIALVNSPALQATYEELGISQADMIQAGLLKNPTLSGSIGFPINHQGITEYEGSLLGDFLDLFVLPLRKRVAKEQFIADTLRVAHEALRTAAEVKQAMVDLEARTELLALRATLVQGTQAGAELAEAQREAGNIRELDVSQQRGASEQASVDLAEEELAVVEARERITSLLGLWGPRAEWKLQEKLPPLPAADPPLDHLEATAIRQRLDIDAARKQAFVYWNALALARDSRVLGLVNVGLHAHQDANGPRLFGPNLSLELPLFDQRQALIGRLEATYRQAVRKLDALSITTRSHVRLERARLVAARKMADRFRTGIMPVRERAVQQGQLQYNAMQIGLYELLAVKQSQVESYRGYLDALRAYWNARAELELELGGQLGAPPKKEM